MPTKSRSRAPSKAKRSPKKKVAAAVQKAPVVEDLCEIGNCSPDDTQTLSLCEVCSEVTKCEECTYVFLTTFFTTVSQSCPV